MMTMTHSPFDERPPALNEPEPPRVWPFGSKAVRGRLLSSFTTAQLVGPEMRQYLERNNVGGDLDYLIAQIDSVLEERGGLL